MNNYGNKRRTNRYAAFANKIRFAPWLLLAALGVTALATTASAQSWLKNGLVAYYPFNGDLSDAIHPTNAAVIVSGGWGVGRLGVPKTALLLDGNPTGGVRIANSAIPAYNSPRTYSVWLKASLEPNTNTFRYLLSTPWNSIPAGGVALRVNGMTPGYPWASVSIDYSWSPTTTLQTPLTQGLWSQLVITLETNQTKMYVNGTRIPLSGDGMLPQGFSFNTVPDVYSLGIYEGQPGFVGALSDLRFYNRALSSNEVAELYLIEATPRIALLKAVKPSFSNLSIGAKYQLQMSGDSNIWTNQGSVFTATDTSMIYPQYWDVDNWGSLFFRLQIQ